jgi:hypothetical protein
MVPFYTGLSKIDEILTKIGICLLVCHSRPDRESRETGKDGLDPLVKPEDDNEGLFFILHGDTGKWHGRLLRCPEFCDKVQ